MLRWTLHQKRLDYRAVWRGLSAGEQVGTMPAPH